MEPDIQENNPTETTKIEIAASKLKKYQYAIFGFVGLILLVFIVLFFLAPKPPTDNVQDSLSESVQEATEIDSSMSKKSLEQMLQDPRYTLEVCPTQDELTCFGSGRQLASDLESETYQVYALVSNGKTANYGLKNKETGELSVLIEENVDEDCVSLSVQPAYDPVGLLDTAKPSDCYTLERPEMSYFKGASTAYTPIIPATPTECIPSDFVTTTQEQRESLLALKPGENYGPVTYQGFNCKYWLQAGEIVQSPLLHFTGELTIPVTFTSVPGKYNIDFDNSILDNLPPIIKNYTQWDWGDFGPYLDNYYGYERTSTEEIQGTAEIVLEDFLVTNTSRLHQIDTEFGRVSPKELSVVFDGDYSWRERVWQERIEQYPYKLISITQDDYEFQVIDQPVASSYGGRVYVRYRNKFVDHGLGSLYLDVMIDSTASSSWFVTDQDINGDGVPDLGLRNDFNERYIFYETDASGSLVELTKNLDFDFEYKESIKNAESDITIWGIQQYSPITIDGTTYSSSSRSTILSYNEKAFYIGQRPVYSVDAGSFEIYPTKGAAFAYNFIRLGNQIFGMGFMGLGSVQLHEKQEVDYLSFKDIGNGYAIDKEYLYYVSTPEPLLSLNGNSHLFLELEAVSEPVLVVGNIMFHRGKILEDLDYSTLHIGNAEDKPKGYYLSDNDNTVYLQGVQCHVGSYYSESSLDEIAGWRPGC